MTSENEPQRPRVVRDPLTELTFRDFYDACVIACGPDANLILDYDPERKAYVMACFSLDGLYHIERIGRSGDEVWERMWLALTEPDPAADEATDELLATVKAARQEA